MILVLNYDNDPSYEHTTAKLWLCRFSKNLQKKCEKIASSLYNFVTITVLWS